jgi:cation transporter-like permease
MTNTSEPIPTDVKTEQRRRGIIVLLLILAPFLMILSVIVAVFGQFVESGGPSTPVWIFILIALAVVVLALLAPALLFAAGISQLRRGSRTGLGWAAVWVGTVLILLGLLLIGLAHVIPS